MAIRERIKAAWPKREERIPFLGSFGVALLGKAPMMVANTAGTLVIVEKMKENPDLISLGIAAYAFFTLATAALDYVNLRRGRVGGSAKANTLYRGLIFLFPNQHEFNAAGAEIGTVLMNIIGINPDLTAPASTAISLATGDATILIGQRVSDMMVSLATQVPFNIFLYARNKKIRNNP